MVRQQPYHIPEAQRAALEAGTYNMCQLGVIEQSQSPRSTPVVMVPKLDRSLQFCPLPQTDELTE